MYKRLKGCLKAPQSGCDSPVTGLIANETSSIGRSFKSDERGSVGIIFALTTLVVVSVVGGAVDYGRATTAREQMQNALDSSVLAAGRVWQITGDITQSQLAAEKYFYRNKPRIVENPTVSFVPSVAMNKLVMEASAVLATPFLSMVRTEGYQIYTKSEAELAVGGNAETSLEVSLMLDVTGSMAGSKLLDMQDAAKDLIDIIVWSDQSEYTSRVALVPFSARVNVGSYAPQLTGLSPTYSGKKLIDCVTEREGSDQFTDKAPEPSRYLGYYKPNNGTSSQYSNSGNCSQPAAEIMPLTNDKSALKARINSFEASGSTAGSLGTAWAWYMLSPKWANIWPTTSRPAPYHTQKLQKIAVLMTDGEYNYFSGGSKSSSTVNSYAQSLCTGMKNEGITVYTVGFSLGSNNSAAKTMLQNCATDSTKFYDAEDGAALRQAFRDIALQLAKLRLSN
ncbi:MAG: pilus assembly protein TadG-related protein [Hyphomicrobiaceae bacterium]